MREARDTGRGGRILPDGALPMQAEILEPVLLGTTANAEHFSPSLVPNPEGPPPAVHCKKVCKWFGSFQALKDVDLRVERGEVVSVIGRSGSGKSTLVRAMNRLEPHTTGSIQILGEELTDDIYLLRFLRERIGMVFQEFNLFGHLSVETNVALGPRRVHGVPADTAHDLAMAALEQVGMATHASKWPSQLSGGEQQRVAIARMLAMSPDIVLLDEPTASIDPELTKGVMELIREIAESQVTVVAVTHEMSFVNAVSDRVVFMEEGSIVEEGPADVMLHEPRHPRTRRFLRDTNVLITTHAG